MQKSAFFYHESSSKNFLTIKKSPNKGKETQIQFSPIIKKEHMGPESKALRIEIN